MPYIIETWDRPDTLDLRRQVRPEHLEYLERNKHLLLACGAKLTDEGSDAGGGLYVLDVETREEAQAFIAADPFHKAGLFDRVAVARWRKAYLARQCYL
jgi:uncharacterized protein YciI